MDDMENDTLLASSTSSKHKYDVTKPAVLPFKTTESVESCTTDNGKENNGLPNHINAGSSEQITREIPNQSCAQFRRLLAFALSCIAKFVTGAVFVFFVYQDRIKQTFHYSQKEVEVLAAMMNIGIGLSFLPGMFFDRFGPRKTSAVGLIVATGSYLLVWSTTFSVDFYKDKSWLMSIFFLLTGFGPGFTMMVALNTNVMNFDKKHTGKIVGTLNAFFAGSPSAFATIYYNLFTKGDTRNTANQDFRGFMLMMAICFTVVNLLDLVFVYRIRTSYSQPLIVVEQTSSVLSDDQHNSLNNDVNAHHDDDVELEREPEESIPLLKLLSNINFVLLLVIFTGAATVSLVFGVNVTTVSKSMQLDHYNEWLTVISPCSNAVFSISIGFFSDYFKERIPRLQIIVGGCVAFALCTLLVVTLPNSIAALAVASLFCGVGIAFLFSMTPTLLKERFGIRNFGRNWGLALMCFAAMGMPSQILFGAMYDAHVMDKSHHDCFGSKCIVGGMSVFLGLAILTIALGVVMLNLNKIRSCCRRDLEL